MNIGKKVMVNFKKKLCIVILLIIPSLGYCLDFNNKNEANYIINNFKFNDGSTMSNLSIHYITLGNPKNKPILVLHGTTGNGASMLNDSFGHALFDKGMPLDAEKYFIILPDAIGTGQSSKPSDGMKSDFPHYDYTDMVNAQYQLVKNGLGIDHLELIIGNSMGGMNTWNWVTMYPDFMTAAVPMAATPAPMSSRNWIMRKMVINAIKDDPDWKNGFYDKQPEKFQTVYNYYNIATNGGDIAWQNKAYSTAKTEELLASTLKERITMDTNDFLFQWDAARNFDPTKDLIKIKAHILAINSEDDERNPPTTGLMEKAIKNIPHVKYVLIPASIKTSGHSTTMTANLWKHHLTLFLKEIEDNK